MEKDRLLLSALRVIAAAVNVTLTHPATRKGWLNTASAWLRRCSYKTNSAISCLCQPGWCSVEMNTFFDATSCDSIEKTLNGNSTRGRPNSGILTFGSSAYSAPGSAHPC